MRQLAADADERWKSTPSFLDAPQRQQPAPATSITDSKPPTEEQTEAEDTGGVKSGVGDQQEVASVTSASRDQDGSTQKAGKREREPSPWQKPQQGKAGEGWQPGSWTPGVVQRR